MYFSVSVVQLFNMFVSLIKNYCNIMKFGCYHLLRNYFEDVLFRGYILVSKLFKRIFLTEYFSEIIWS